MFKKNLLVAGIIVTILTSLTQGLFAGAAYEPMLKPVFAERASLALWVKADDYNGGAAWADSSINGNNLELVGTASKLDSVAELNGRPAVDLGGTGMFRTAFATPYTGGSTIFMVMKPEVADGRGTFTSANGLVGAEENLISLRMMSSGKMEVHSYDSGGGFTNTDRACEPVDTTIRGDKYLNYTYRMSESGWGKYWYNNGYVSMAADTVSELLSQEFPLVGDNNPNGRFLQHDGVVIGSENYYSDKSDMQVAEVLVFHERLTDDEVVDIRAYLSRKYFEEPIDADPENSNDPILGSLSEDPALNLWLKASTGLIGKPDGDFYWGDQSGKGNDMKLKGSVQPLRGIGGLNGRTVFNLGGAGSFSTKYAIPHLGDSTIFMVMKPDLEYYYKVFSTGDGITPIQNNILETQMLAKMESYSYFNPANESSRIGIDRACDAANGTIRDNYMSYTYRVSKNVNESSVYTGTETSYWYNNGYTDTEDPQFLSGGFARDMTGQGSPDLLLQHNGFVIGSGGDLNNSSNMQVAEVLVFLRKLDNSEVEAVRSYLNQKYFGAEAGAGIDQIIPSFYDDESGPVNGGKIKFTGSLRNYFETTSISASNFVAAIYEDNRLVGVKVLNIPAINALSDTPVDTGYIDLPDTITGEISVKLMLLDSVDTTLKPIAKYIPFEW